MHNCITALHCSAHVVGITDITAEHFELASQRLSATIKPATEIEEVVKRKGTIVIWSKSALR